MAREHLVLDLISSLNSKTLKSRLNRIPDYDLALVLLYMEDRDKDYVYDYLPLVKTDRVREQLRILRRKRIGAIKHQYAHDRVHQVLSGRKDGAINRRFFRCR